MSTHHEVRKMFHVSLVDASHISRRLAICSRCGSVWASFITSSQRAAALRHNPCASSSSAFLFLTTDHPPCFFFRDIPAGIPRKGSSFLRSIPISLSVLVAALLKPPNVSTGSGGRRDFLIHLARRSAASSRSLSVSALSSTSPHRVAARRHNPRSSSFCATLSAIITIVSGCLLLAVLLLNLRQSPFQ